MGDKIWLNMQDLDEVNAGLVTTIEEFENAASANDRAEEAIGRPDDRSELRDKVDDFENAWNGKRDALKESLQELQERLQGVIDGWREFDLEAQRSLESAGPDNTPVN